MCLGIPMRIKKIEKETAVVRTGGLEKKINVGFLKDIKIGDYVIVHAGFAIEKVNEKKAKETLALFNEISR